MPKSNRNSPAYSPAWGQCRFCKQTALQSELVKYSVRHHAHAVCLYQHRGIDALNELHTWQLRHLPIVALMGAGVPLEQVRVWGARIEAEDGTRDTASTRARPEDESPGDA